MTKQEQNKKDVKLHYQLRKLNEIRFETSRLKTMDSLEQEYVIRNQAIITDDPFYKELLQS